MLTENNQVELVGLRGSIYESSSLALCFENALLALSTRLSKHGIFSLSVGPSSFLQLKAIKVSFFPEIFVILSVLDEYFEICVCTYGSGVQSSAFILKTVQCTVQYSTVVKQ
jgi:hypothetical protein